MSAMVGLALKIAGINLPRTLFKKQWGETEYGIGIVPLGGYVKMLGQDDNPANAAPPNILLIISDDVGTDVTSDMYPGLIDGLVSRYGPSGSDHPDYQRISAYVFSHLYRSDVIRQIMSQFLQVFSRDFHYSASLT